MKSKLRLRVLVPSLLVNLSTISTYNGNKNTNLSIGWILLFIPIMIGILFLAHKNEIK